MSLNKNLVTQALQGRGGFSIVPNELWRMDIPHAAKTVWAYLLSQPPDWDCSRNNIARNLKIGRQSVTDVLNLLISFNMISIESKSRGTWHISMLPPASWSSVELSQESGLNDSEEEKVEQNAIKTTTTGSNRDRSQPQPVSVAPTSNTRIEEKEKENLAQRPPIDDIYRKWLSEVPERPNFKACYEELLVLFASIKKASYNVEDISPSMRKKILKRWERSKYPDKHMEWLDKALGAVFCEDVKLTTPDIKESLGLPSQKKDGQITLDTAMKMLTDDDEVSRIIREYEIVKNTPREEIDGYE